MEFSRAQLESINFENILKYGPTANCEYEHYFYGDLYIRSCSFKKGTIAVGGRHKGLFPVLLIKGKVYRIENGTKEYWKAPHFSKSCNGHYRFFYALEDSTIISIHATNVTDIPKLESMYCDDILFQKGKAIKEIEHVILECGSVYSRNYNRDCNSLPAEESCRSTEKENERSC